MGEVIQHSSHSVAEALSPNQRFFHDAMSHLVDVIKQSYLRDSFLTDVTYTNEGKIGELKITTQTKHIRVCADLYEGWHARLDFHDEHGCKASMTLPFLREAIGISGEECDYFLEKVQRYTGLSKLNLSSTDLHEGLDPQQHAIECEGVGRIEGPNDPLRLG